jgi:hypothetical protein
VALRPRAIAVEESGYVNVRRRTLRLRRAYSAGMMNSTLTIAALLETMS